jgi:hypothetical protein
MGSSVLHVLVSVSKIEDGCLAFETHITTEDVDVTSDGTCSVQLSWLGHGLDYTPRALRAVELENTRCS